MPPPPPTPTTTNSTTSSTRAARRRRTNTNAARYNTTTYPNLPYSFDTPFIPTGKNFVCLPIATISPSLSLRNSHPVHASVRPTFVVSHRTVTFSPTLALAQYEQLKSVDTPPTIDPFGIALSTATVVSTSTSVAIAPPCNVPNPFANPGVTVNTHVNTPGRGIRPESTHSRDTTPASYVVVVVDDARRKNARAMSELSASAATPASASLDDDMSDEPRALLGRSHARDADVDVDVDVDDTHARAHARTARHGTARSDATRFAWNAREYETKFETSAMREAETSRPLVSWEADGKYYYVEMGGVPKEMYDALDLRRFDDQRRAEEAAKAMEDEED
jgi:hypothetical protein